MATSHPETKAVTQNTMGCPATKLVRSLPSCRPQMPTAYALASRHTKMHRQQLVADHDGSTTKPSHRCTPKCQVNLMRRLQKHTHGYRARVYKPAAFPDLLVPLIAAIRIFSRFVSVFPVRPQKEGIGGTLVPGSDRGPPKAAHDLSLLGSFRKPLKRPFTGTYRTLIGPQRENNLQIKVFFNSRL